MPQQGKIGSEMLIDETYLLYFAGWLNGELTEACSRNQDSEIQPSILQKVAVTDIRVSRTGKRCLGSNSFPMCAGNRASYETVNPIFEICRTSMKQNIDLHLHVCNNNLSLINP